MAKDRKPKIIRTISPVEALLGMMACISLALLFIPMDWATKTLVVNPRDYPAMIGDDTFSGGNSKAIWLDKKEQIWRCTMGSAFPAPYCNLSLTMFSETWSGLDLREYQTLTIWGKYKGNGDHLRLYLRNRHPKYYVMGDTSSTKYNMVEFPVDNLETGFTFSMKDFSVADWWLAQRKIPLELSHPEFNDIVYIEVQTGSASNSGVHDIQLKQLVWRGELFSQEMLYKWVVISWSAVIFLMLLYRMFRLKFELTKNQRYQEELISINKLLNLQNKQFEDLAKTDQLTGLFNRIGIRDTLYDGLHAWKSDRTPFSFVMIDIDHFKKINDTHGHDIGDQVLQHSAHLLKENVRRSDVLARWGGEEFILVCPNTDLKQGEVVAELLRSKLEEAEIIPGVKITASFGVATLSEPNLDHLFKSADEALYEAKAQGRNMVVCKH